MGQYRHNPDGLFYEKRYVVLLKMTRRFSSTDVSFLGVSKCRIFVIIKAFVNVQCDTCDSKKTKLLWYVRLYA